MSPRSSWTAIKLTAIRPVYAGKLLTEVVCAAKPQLVTLRGRAFDKPVADAGRSGTVTKIPAVMAEDEIKLKVTGYQEADGGVSLTDANVIVSGGRGTAITLQTRPRRSPMTLRTRSGRPSRASS